MQPTVYGSNHIALEVTDAEAAARFYQEVFGLERYSGGEGNAFLRLGPHQFLALFQTSEPHCDAHRHFGIIVKDDAEIAEVRRRLEERSIALIPPFACDFRDPWGNRIQVVDLSVVSPAWAHAYDPEMMPPQ
ncbi:MAG: VOC family protein [Armatimonadetes bacterium]|nr:VOC family protein [Armatimonadota bacterium]